MNYTGLVRKVSFLSEISTDYISEFVLKLQLNIYFPGDGIIQEDKEGDAMLFLEHGRVNVHLADDSHLAATCSWLSTC